MSRGDGFGAGRSGCDPRRGRGQAGEELARRFLEHRGYDILQTNYRSRYGELDIVARQDDIVAFVEVKARLGSRYGKPFEAVNPRKQHQIRRMAEMWVAANAGDRDLRRCRFRFDVISIDLAVAGIEHMEDAFR